jgi:hypothetical protein
MGLRGWRGRKSCTKRFDTPHTFESVEALLSRGGAVA